MNFIKDNKKTITFYKRYLPLIKANCIRYAHPCWITGFFSSVNDAAVNIFW